MPYPTSRSIAFFLVASFFSVERLLADSQLAIELVAHEASVTWTGGILQTAPSLAGPWSVAVGATSPHKVSLAQRAFFRVQEAYAVTASKSGTGTGRIRSLVAGIDCGDDCVETILSGQNFTLQAVPDDGSTFTGWTGDCAGTGDCQLAVNGLKAVTAMFTKSAAANPVINGGFEEGGAGWEQQPGLLIFPAAQLGVAAHSGQNVARLGYTEDNRRLVRIGQQITLPNSTPLFLNFATWIFSEELCDVPYYDAITIYVAGQKVVNDERVCRSSNTDGWRQYSIDLTAAAGLTVAFVFELSSVDFLSTIMLLDDISISNQSWQ